MGGRTTNPDQTNIDMSNEKLAISQRYKRLKPFKSNMAWVLSLPILIQWKWQEKTETFLLIVHFDADSSKPNLRSREMIFSPSVSHKLAMYIPSDLYLDLRKERIPSDMKKRTVITWSPSHVETGLLQELLSYANIINGFKKPIRQELRSKLEVAVIENTETIDNDLQKARETLEKEGFLYKRTLLIGYEPNYKDEYKGNLMYCFELCEEYIGYLRNVLKEYM